jgi:hypothetical protein
LSLWRRHGRESASRSHAALARLAPLSIAAAVFIPLNYSALANLFRYQAADFRGIVTSLAEGALPGDGMAVPAFRSVGETAGIKWYSSRNRKLRAVLPVRVVSSLEDLQPLLEKHARLWFITVEPLVPGSKPALSEMNQWVKAHSTEVKRLPHVVYSRDLGVPVMDNEIVLYRCEKNA